MAKRLTKDMFILRCQLDKDKDGTLTQISLVHMKGMAPDELHTVKFSPGAAVDAKEIAEVFTGRAESYVQELPGLHTFHLFAFFGGRKEKEDSFLFTVRVAGDQDGLLTESPTAQGQMQQEMRHTENRVQQTYQKQAHLDMMQIKMNEMLLTQVTAAREESFRAFDIVKQLLLEKVQDNNVARMAQLTYERDTEMRNALFRIGPALANNILGKNVFPQATEDTSIVESIAEHLISANADQSNVAAMLGAFPPEIQAVVMSRIQRYAQSKLAMKQQAEESRMLHPKLGEGAGLADAKGDS